MSNIDYKCWEWYYVNVIKIGGGKYENKWKRIYID